MVIRINSTNYSAIKNLSFAPQTDLTGDSVPINEFEVDIITQDTISVAQYAALYDNLQNLWAKYWIVFAERINADTVRIRAQSLLSVLEKKTLAAVMYNEMDVSILLDIIFQPLGGSSAYELDSSFANATISGFCPEQTAKERLQWVCFVIGAYVKSYFSNKIEIKAVDNTETLVDIKKTFWKPSITYRDYVTAINVVAYVFRQASPDTISSVDEWVTDSNHYYVVTSYSYQLSNPSVPQDVPTNEITIDGVYLVNESNVSGILTRLSDIYFNRVELDSDIINNAEYEPGQRLTVYADEDRMLTGYMESCAFSFGLQARSAIHLTALEDKDSAVLIITYMYHNSHIGKARYRLPIGYGYSIENPYVDSVGSLHRYVYRPLQENATGTITSGTNTDTEQYEIALHMYFENGILHIISVTGVTSETDEEEVVVIIE